MSGIHFRKIGIKSGMYFWKIGIKSGIHLGKIGIRNGYVFETSMARPRPKSGQVPPIEQNNIEPFQMQRKVFYVNTTLSL